MNITNSHSRLVLNQLENTDAHLVKVYTAGSITIVYTEAPEYNEILLISDKHEIQPKEIEKAKNYFLDKIKDAVYHEDEIKVVELAGLVETSIPKHKSDATLAIQSTFEYNQRSK